MIRLLPFLLLMSCASPKTDEHILLDGEETLLVPFPKGMEAEQAEERRMLRNNPIFNDLWK